MLISGVSRKEKDRPPVRRTGEHKVLRAVGYQNEISLSEAAGRPRSIIVFFASRYPLNPLLSFGGSRPTSNDPELQINLTESNSDESAGRAEHANRHGR